MNIDYKLRNSFHIFEKRLSETSNQHPEQILLKCVLRSQATEKINVHLTSAGIRSKTLRAAKTLDLQGTTKIPFEITKEYPDHILNV